MQTKRLNITPALHGKLTLDGKLSEPDIYFILEKWLERHPAFKGRENEIRIVRGRWTLPEGIGTDVVSVSAIESEDIAGYDPAQDRDLYEYYLAEERYYQEPQKTALRSDVFQIRGDSSLDPNKLIGKLPLITKEGQFDPAQFPVDSVLKQAFSDDDQEFRTGLNVLRSMYGQGRMEAGVFLLGVFVSCDDNWEKRIGIVEVMTGMHTKPCANLLFGELKRVPDAIT